MIRKSNFVRSAPRLLLTVGLTLLCLIPKLSNAQQDTEFWFVAPRVTEWHDQRPTKFKFATGTAASTTIRITRPADMGIDQQVTLGPLQMGEFDIDTDLLYPTAVGNEQNSVVTNYGILITSDNPISVYYEASGEAKNPDIFSLKGQNALGTEFVTPFQTYWENVPPEVPVPQWFTDPPKSAIDIVATEDNTNITVTLSDDVVGYAAGSVVNITLNRGQTYRFKALDRGPGDRLNGTRIVSDKPIAVTISDDSVKGVHEDLRWCADLVGDQLIPVSVLGMEYVVMKGWLELEFGDRDQVFIQAVENNTSIQIQSNSGTENHLASVANTVNYNLSDPSAYITADKPIYVFHVSGNGCETGGAIIPPFDRCTGSKDIAFVRTDPDRFGLNIVVKTGSEGNFTTSGGTGFSINAGDFQDVPGSGGTLKFLNREYNTTEVPHNANIRVTNSTTFFHLGMINGEAEAGGTRYGYFSSFANLELGDDQTVCPGTAVILDPTNGNTPDSFLWQDSSNGSTFSAVDPGTYSVTATFGGCTTSDDVEITHVAGSGVDLGEDRSICEGSLLDAGAGQASYLWNTGANSQTINVATAGTYSVTVTGITGCVASDEITISPDTDPQVDLVDASFCPGDDYTLDAGAGYKYIWSNGSTNQTLTVSTAGTYSVTVENGGCTAADQATLSFHTLPTVNLIDAAICEGQTETLNAGTGFTYNWSTGDDSQTIDVDLANTYGVTITDGNGCSANDDMTLTVNSNPTIDLADVSDCQGAMVTLDAGSGFSGYLWSTNANSQTINGTPGNTYSVTVTDGNSCQAIDDITINTFTPPSITDLIDTCLSPIDSFRVTFTITGGDASSYFVNGLSGTLTGSDFVSDNLADATTYTVSVDDANGCGPDIVSGVRDCGCSTESTSMTGSPIEACGPATVSASHSGAFTNDGNDTIIYVLHTSGNAALGTILDSAKTPEFSFIEGVMNFGVTYYISAVAGDHTGDGWVDLNDPCRSVTAGTSVIFHALPEANLMDQSTCEGINATISAGTFSAYLWSNGESTPSISTADAGTYSVTVTDANTCTDRDTMELTTYALPIIDLVDDAVCEGESTVIDAGAGYISYEWNIGASDATITVTQAGTYAVTVTDANGCSGNGSMSFSLHPLPVVSLADATICEGNSHLFDAGAGYSYAWSDGTFGQTITVNSTNAYTVTVTDGNSCSSTATSSLTVQPLPSPVLTTLDACAQSGRIFTLNSYATYSWTGGSQSSSLLINQSGNYGVTVADQFGCSGSISADYDLVEETVISLTPPASPVCHGDTSVLEITLVDPGNEGPYDLVYTNGGSNQTLEDVTGVIDIPVYTAGSYSIVSVTSAKGCLVYQNSASNNVVVLEPLSVFIDTSGSNCAGGNGIDIAFTAQNVTYPWTLQYTWDNNPEREIITDTNVFIIADAQPANYEFSSIVDDNGCKVYFPDGINPIRIETPVEPDTGYLASPYPGCQNVWLVLESTGNNSKVEWSVNGETFEVNPLEIEIPYGSSMDISMITTQGICKATTNISQSAGSFDSHLDLSDQNVFTPEGDGLNDIFDMDPKDYYTDCSVMHIYNRWGTLIYQGETGNSAWDGEGMIDQAPEGTYYVVFEIEDQKTIYHSVTLFRGK